MLSQPCCKTDTASNLKPVGNGRVRENSNIVKEENKMTKIIVLKNLSTFTCFSTLRLLIEMF